MAPNTSRTFIHPTAICETDDLGNGTRVWAFAHVLNGAKIGRNCNICERVYVESGATLGDGVVVKNGVSLWNGVTLADHVFVGPNVIFTNDLYPRSRYLPEAKKRYAKTSNWLEETFVGEGASIGAGAIILCGIRIGAFATIGAGALVTQNVADHTLAVGQPARAIGWVCRCGQPAGESCVCSLCATTAPTQLLVSVGEA